MIDSNHRDLFQRTCVDPMVEFISTTSLTPMKLTLLGLFFGFLSSVFIALNWSWVGVFALMISGYFDVLDGSLARKTQTSSEVGAAVDIFCDRLVEIFIVTGLFLQAPLERSLYAYAMLASILICITSFLVVGIFTGNDSQKSFHYSPGLMERSEAFIFFFFLILAPDFFKPLAFLFSTLVIYTGLKRMRDFYLHHQQ